MLENMGLGLYFRFYPNTIGQVYKPTKGSCPSPLQKGHNGMGIHQTIFRKEINVIFTKGQCNLPKKKM